MRIPQSVMLMVPNSVPNILNQDTNGRYWNVTIKTYNSSTNSVSEIDIWNICNMTGGCQVGASFSFVIDWIRNPVSQITVGDPILFDMFTPSGYLAERGTTQPVSKLFSSLIPVRIQNL